MATKQQKELRAKWVAALRSGEYEQGFDALHDGDGFCCLGVLLMVMGETPRQNEQCVWCMGGQGEFLSEEQCESVGLTYDNGAFEDPDGTRLALSELNDQRVPFSEIADIIEAEPEGLFKD